jgi:hypothetical protein
MLPEALVKEKYIIKIGGKFKKNCAPSEYYFFNLGHL